MTSQQALDLIAQLDGSRAAMLQALDGTTAELEIYESWNLKHFLAHIAGWDEASVTSLKAHMEGGEYKIPAFRGVDEFNKFSVVTRIELSYEQIYREWELVRDELKAVLRAMPPEKFEVDILFPWGIRDSIQALIQVIVEHEAEHAVDLERAKSV
jgi:hypothetical protein